MSHPKESNDAVYIDDVYCIRESPKAILVRLPGNGEEVDERWIPKSCLHNDSEVYKTGDEGTLAVKEWFAEKEGLA